MRTIERVKLPSNGLLGYTKEVNVQSLFGEELSALYISLSDESINKVLKTIIEAVDNTDINELVNKLCDQDKVFLLHKARQLTLGNELTQTVESPFTGKLQKVIVNYEELKVKYLEEEELNKTLTILNNEGKELTLRRGVPNSDVFNELEDIKQKYELSNFDNEILRIASLINTDVLIGGKKRSYKELIDFLKDLNGKAFVEIRNFVNDFNFGLSTIFTRECEQTKKEFMGVIAFSADLFR